MVKFYRPKRWRAEQILEEHQLAHEHELAEAEIPVVAPLVINNATLHNHLGYYFSLFTSVGGRAFEQDNDEQLEWVGRFLGRIHRHNGSRCFSSRPTLGLEEYLTPPSRKIENSTLISGQQKAMFLQACDQLIAQVQAVWTTD